VAQAVINQAIRLIDIIMVQAWAHRINICSAVLYDVTCAIVEVIKFDETWGVPLFSWIAHGAPHWPAPSRYPLRILRYPRPTMSRWEQLTVHTCGYATHEHRMKCARFRTRARVRLRAIACRHRRFLRYLGVAFAALLGIAVAWDAQSIKCLCTQKSSPASYGAMIFEY
jgi:hypothetical protein